MYFFIEGVNVDCWFYYLSYKNQDKRFKTKERGRFLVKSVKVMCYKLKTVVER